MNGHAVDLGTILAADQFGSCDHVAPLILTAHFQGAAIFPAQGHEVVSLENGVVELKEGKACFQTHLHRLLREHSVDAENGSHFTKQIDISQLAEPFGVVHKVSFAFGAVDEA